MNGENILASLGNLVVNLVEYPAGWLGRRGYDGPHGLQAIVKFVGCDISGADLTFRKLDVKGCLNDIQRCKFIIGQISGAIGYDFHMNTYSLSRFGLSIIFESSH